MGWGRHACVLINGGFSAAVEIDIDQIENEVNNQHDDDGDSVTFDADWQNDLKQLESALDTDSLDQVDVNQEQQEISAELEQVRQALEHDGIEPDQLLHDFYTHLDTDVLHVTSIPAEELQNEEQRRIQAEIDRVQHESEIQRRREAILHDRANKAKSELHEDAKRKQRLLQQKKDLIVLKARLEKENLQKSFSRAEKNLNKILTERQAEVKSLYGDLVVADEQYGGARGRRWRVEWTKSPQPIQIRVDCIRGLKDKIPVGRYAIMVSLYDRLGGHPMQWSTLEGARWGAATIPVAHRDSSGYLHVFIFYVRLETKTTVSAAGNTECILVAVTSN